MSKHKKSNKHKKLHVYVVYEYGRTKKEEARIHGVYFNQEDAWDRADRLGINDYPKPKGTVLEFSVQGNTLEAVCRWLLESGRVY